jgi:hypothetical protein
VNSVICRPSGRDRRADVGLLERDRSLVSPADGEVAAPSALFHESLNIVLLTRLQGYGAAALGIVFPPLVEVGPSRVPSNEFLSKPVGVSENHSSPESSDEMKKV